MDCRDILRINFAGQFELAMVRLRALEVRPPQGAKGRLRLGVFLLTAWAPVGNLEVRKMDVPADGANSAGCLISI